MAHILLPATSAEDWQKHLADPIKHWETGFSAKTLAYCWPEGGGFPGSVITVFKKAGQPFTKLEPLLILPEHKVPLPGGKAASQNDIWVLARTPKDLMSIAVEGKVNEPFADPVNDWLREGSTGKEERLAFLVKTLGITLPRTSLLRYQLLHRTASAIIEAERFRAEHAMLLIHSFSPTHAWFEDFAAFVAVWGIAAERDRMHSTQLPSGRYLHFAWVHGEERYLSK